MQNFGTKSDDTAGPSGQLSASEFNNLAAENENAVLRSGQVLSGASDTQLAQSLFVHGVKAASFQDSGAANAYVATPISGSGGVLLPSAYSALAGSIIVFKAAATNTGASTLNIGQTTGTLLGNKAIRSQADTALQAGAIAAGQYVQVIYNSAFDSGAGAWELLPWAYTDTSQPPGALNARTSIVGPTVTTTFTADSVTLNTTLGGKAYVLPSFSQSIDISTTGAGGMDTGAAPASGYVAIYAIYNPTTNTRALLGKNATSALQTKVYTGANMPAGFTASALISVLPTNASNQFKVCSQVGLRVAIPGTTVFTGSTGGISVASISIAAAVPINATAVVGILNTSSTLASNIGITLHSSTQLTGPQNASGSVTAGGGANGNFAMSILSAQTLYVSTTNTAGTPSYTVFISEYSI